MVKLLLVLLLVSPVLVSIQKKVHVEELELLVGDVRLDFLLIEEVVELAEVKVDFLLLSLFLPVGPVSFEGTCQIVVGALIEESLVSTCHEPVNDHEELVRLDFCEEALGSSVLLELLVQIVAPLFFRLVYVFLESRLEIGVENSEEQVHHQEKPHDQINYKIEAAQPVPLVGWEHDVGEIGCGHEN